MRRDAFSNNFVGTVSTIPTPGLCTPTPSDSTNEWKANQIDINQETGGKTETQTDMEKEQQQSNGIHERTQESKLKGYEDRTAYAIAALCAPSTRNTQ